MNYQDTLQWLYSQLPMYQRTGKSSFKKDLTNIKQLVSYNNNVHKNFKSIHIAGTNGKGSLAHMLASIYQSAGFKTGLYTSPHLKDFRERIKVNGEMIHKSDVINFVQNNMPIINKIHPSFFEMTVAMAFDHFSSHDVDIAVIETGLGGRLDSTNIIRPEISVITNVSLDHMNILGETIQEIAHEKAGIIKENIPIVLGESNSDYNSIIENKAKEECSKLYYADKEFSAELRKKNQSGQFFTIRKKENIVYSELFIDLLGSYQKKNLLTALQTVDVLIEKLYVNEVHIRNGLACIKKQTGLKGRWEIICIKPLIIADTAHNIAGIQKIIEQINTLEFNQLHFILGMVNDKDIDQILKLLPKNAVYYFTKANIPRAKDENELMLLAQKHGLGGKTYRTTKSALDDAKRHAFADDLIFIGGSTFTVAEIV